MKNFGHDSWSKWTMHLCTYGLGFTCYSLTFMVIKWINMQEIESGIKDIMKLKSMLLCTDTLFCLFHCCDWSSYSMQSLSWRNTKLPKNFWIQLSARTNKDWSCNNVLAGQAYHTPQGCWQIVCNIGGMLTGRGKPAPELHPPYIL